MAIIDTPEEICLCGGKLNFVRDSPNHVCGQYAPQDEIWTCPLCGKFFLKTWHPDNIDYYTENADYDAHFVELKSDHRLCVICNGFRTTENPVFHKQPVCNACFLAREWEELFRKGKVKKNAPSDEELSDFLAGARALENNYFVEAGEKIQPFAETGHSLAETYFGAICENGPASIKNNKIALEWYKKAARQQLPHAFYRVGKLYCSCSEVGIDNPEAYKWFNLGAYFGDFACVAAREAVSKNLSHNEILKAQEESCQELKKSWHGSDCRLRVFENLKNTKGELEGTLRFSEILEGKNFKIFLQDFNAAEKLLRNLAQDGFPPAMLRLGEKLTLGLGSEKNVEEASKLLTQAISRGNFPAMEFCWNEITRNSELKIDSNWLKTTFLTAIDAGNPQAIHFWGQIHQLGTGVPVMHEEAHKWFNLAQYIGVKLPFPSPLDTLERSLTPEQLVKAVNSAQEWIEGHLAKNQNLRRFSKSFRERVMTDSIQKWQKLGELFRSGSEGYLRNIVIAYGCFELACRKGDSSARLRLESIGRNLPPELVEMAPRMALQMEMTGNLPALPMAKEKDR